MYKARIAYAIKLFCIIFVTLIPFIFILVYWYTPKILMHKIDKGNHYYVFKQANIVRLCFDKKCNYIEAEYSSNHDQFLDYLNYMMIGSLYPRNINNILMFGLGGGTLAKYTHKKFPQSNIEIVEIDNNIINLAKDYFSFNDSKKLKVTLMDACQFEISRNYDLVSIDIFSNPGNKIPRCLFENSLYQNIKSQLNQNGTLVINTINRDDIDKITYFLKQNFVHVDYYNAKNHVPSNIIIIAYNGKYVDNHLIKERSRIGNWTHDIEQLLIHRRTIY